MLPTTSGSDAKDARLGTTCLLLLPMDPGAKTRHLAILSHRGGGWYDVRCMGQGTRCKAGTCKHTAKMRYGSPNGRPVRQMPCD